MDRKQREDAINEVSNFDSSDWLALGARAQSYASSLHHYIQRIVHGQALSVYRHGLRRWRRPLYEDCKLEEGGPRLVQRRSDPRLVRLDGPRYQAHSR
jgi:hypothetical protein